MVQQQFTKLPPVRACGFESRLSRSQCYNFARGDVRQWYSTGSLNRNSKEFCGFESHRLRQLGNEVIGSPATRARQPFFGEISSRFEFSIKFEPTFLRNARICVLSPCDKIPPASPAQIRSSISAKIFRPGSLAVCASLSVATILSFSLAANSSR